jgi:hypothetical protein
MSSIGVVVGLVAGSMSALTQHEPSMDRDESCGGGSSRLEVIWSLLDLPKYGACLPHVFELLGVLSCAPRSCYACPWFWSCVLTVAVT